MKKLLFPFSFLITASCTSHIATLQEKHESSIAIHEIQSEVAELKHLIQNTQIELQILDEEVKKQEHTQTKKSTTSSSDSKVLSLEKRLSTLEREQGKLSNHANQTTSCLTEYSTKIAELENTLLQQKKILGELIQLKTTLNSLTASLEKADSSKETYKVKPGDSLEKIARLHKVSVSSLKEANNLVQNKIIIGQELKIPTTD